MQAPPGWGKTTAALTFPDPLVLNMDNKLPRNRKVRNVPMHDPGYCRELYKQYGNQAEPNLRDVFRMWWEKEMPLVNPSTTIVTDSTTMLNNSVVLQCMKEAKVSLKTGELDLRKAWGEVLNYFFYMHEVFKRYQGIHIVICHEYVDRDEKGQVSSAFTPLFTGGFKDQFASHYTDYWRMNLEHEKDAAGKVVNTKYMWQLKASPLFTPIVSFPPPAAFVEADFKNIQTLITNTNP